MADFSSPTAASSQAIRNTARPLPADAIRVDEKFIHSTRLVLVDKAGIIRGYYDGLSQDEAEPKRLIADIRRLLAE